MILIFQTKKLTRRVSDELSRSDFNSAKSLSAWLKKSNIKTTQTINISQKSYILPHFFHNPIIRSNNKLYGYITDITSQKTCGNILHSLLKHFSINSICTANLQFKEKV